MKKSTLFLLMLLLGFSLQAQQISPLKPNVRKIEALHQQGKQFMGLEVFQEASSATTNKKEVGNLVKNATLLTLKTPALRQAINQEASAVVFSIPSQTHGTLELELVRVNIFTPDFGVRTDASGKDYVPYSGGVHYRGMVKGDAHSTVAISMFEEEVMGLIATTEGNFVLGKLNDEPAGGMHILYNDRDLAEIPARPACATPDEGTYAPEDLLPQSALDKAGDCIRIYLEADRDVYQDKGSVSNVVNWITGVFNETAALYSDENINMALSEVFVWTSNSGYNGNNASVLLNAFQNSRSNFNGDMAQLINFKNAGGIAASIGGLCTGNKRDAMSYAGVYNYYYSVPTYSYTVEMVAHELGHLFNSRHTHACVWNGNNTAIDGCSSVEGSCARPGLPAGGGTIMSYCDFTSVGIDFTLGFGSQPGNVIRNYVAAANCLSASCGGSTNTCNNGVQDGDETGVDCGGSCAPCGGGGSCDTPGGLEATQIKRNRANLGWNSVSAAVSYTVQLRSAGSSTWTEGTASGTGVTASSLNNGTTYEWRVRSNCNGSVSAYSSICSFTAGSSSSSSCNGSRPAAQLTVYPNPADQQIRVMVPGESQTLQIMDVFGRVVQTVQVNGSNTSLDIQTYAPGIYFLTAFSESGEQQTVKFVKN